MARQKRCNGEGSIRKRERNGKVSWEGRYTDADGRQRSVSAKTRKECFDKMRAAKETVTEDSDYDKDITLDEWADTFFTVYNAGIRDTTLRVKRDWAYKNIISPVLGKKRIRDITRNDVLDLKKDISDGLSSGSVKVIVGVLKGLFRDAEKEGIVPETVIKGIDVPCDTKRIKKRELTEREIEIFLEYAGDKRKDLVIAFELLLNTGMRCGEALALQWKDVDAEYRCADINKTVTVTGGINPPKNKGSLRKVPLNSFLQEELRKHREYIEKLIGESGSAAETKDEFIVTPDRKYLKRDTARGNPVLVSSFNTWIKDIIGNRIRKDYPEYPIFTSHYLRHTFACRAVYNSMPMMYLQKICGWTDGNMLSKVYGHMTPDQSYAAMCGIPPLGYGGAV